jgi:hypothetical protein
MFPATLMLASVVAFVPQSTDVQHIDASTPRDVQIRLAREAAPSEVGREATIYVLGPKGYEKVVGGKPNNAANETVHRAGPRPRQDPATDRSRGRGGVQIGTIPRAAKAGDCVYAFAAQPRLRSRQQEDDPFSRSPDVLRALRHGKRGGFGPWRSVLGSSRQARCADDRCSGFEPLTKVGSRVFPGMRVADSALVRWGKAARECGFWSRVAGGNCLGASEARPLSRAPFAEPTAAAGRSLALARSLARTRTPSPNIRRPHGPAAGPADARAHKTR